MRQNYRAIDTLSNYFYLKTSVKLWTVKVMATANAYKSETDFVVDTGKLRRGDIVGVTGNPGK